MRRSSAAPTSHWDEETRGAGVNDEPPAGLSVDASVRKTANFDDDAYKPLVLQNSEEGGSRLRQTCYFNPKQSNINAIKVLSH